MGYRDVDNFKQVASQSSAGCHFNSDSNRATILKIAMYRTTWLKQHSSSCQTYEGGILGEPGSEAHGGYTFCGLAAMILINEVHGLDLSRLIDWVVFRQGVEGGFHGRTNKLVDGCYSFWQGGVFAILPKYCSIGNDHLVLHDTEEGDYSTDSPYSTSGSDISKGEEGLDGISSQTDDTCHLKQEGVWPIFSSHHHHHQLHSESVDYNQSMITNC